MLWNESLKQNLIAHVKDRESNLSSFAFRSENATHFSSYELDVRPPFFRDSDRIMHSLSYSRYIDKTQVFYLVENDHITHRVLHVQLVSKIARTISRFLNLNEDLVEAISLGHDVGHTPFGHDGEKYISNFLREKDAGIFEHNIQSFRLFHELEQHGNGMNLSVQVLDGIICHNGEMLETCYKNNPSKTAETLLQEYRQSLTGEFSSKYMVPMTLEGCVMRISDVIAYVGRDIEDAIKLKLISREEIPANITDILGNNNKDIVNNLIIDLVSNSYEKDSLQFSAPVSEALEALKAWNYKHIYGNERKATQDKKIENMFKCVLEACLSDLESNTQNTGIAYWLSTMIPAYHENSKPRIVADYVSGMTDDFLMRTYKNLVIPQSFGMNF